MKRLLAAVAVSLFGVTALVATADTAEAAPNCVLINLTIQITPGSEVTLLCL